MKNWKTTLTGVLTIAGGIALILKGDYQTAVITIIGGIGLLLAKDYDTTGVGPYAEKP